jgi:hypothetical protein
MMLAAIVLGAFVCGAFAVLLLAAYWPDGR